MPISHLDSHQRVCAGERTKMPFGARGHWGGEGGMLGALGVCGGQAAAGRAPTPGDAGRNRPSHLDCEPRGPRSASVAEHLPGTG